MNSRKKNLRRARLKASIRSKISGTPQKPRLSVYRSNSQIYVQIINDLDGQTLLAASSMEKGFTIGSNRVETAKLVGKAIAEKAQSANIKNVVFDRNGFLYHGRIKALAEGAREGGLNF